MDTKEMLKKLIKIAENQQNIINKIAQKLPPPTDLKPAPTQKDAAQVVFDALDPTTKESVDYMYTRTGDMYIKFKEGKKSQAVYNVVFKTLQRLTNEGKVQQAYALKVAE